MWEKVKIFTKEVTKGVPNAMNGGTLTSTGEPRTRKGTIVKSRDTGNMYYFPNEEMKSPSYTFDRFKVQRRLGQAISKIETRLNDHFDTDYVLLAEEKAEEIRDVIDKTGISVPNGTYSKVATELLKSATELKQKQEEYRRAERNARRLLGDILAVYNATKYQKLQEKIADYNQRQAENYQRQAGNYQRLLENQRRGGATRGAQPTFGL